MKINFHFFMLILKVLKLIYVLNFFNNQFSSIQLKTSRNQKPTNISWIFSKISHSIFKIFKVIITSCLQSIGREMYKSFKSNDKLLKTFCSYWSSSSSSFLIILRGFSQTKGIKRRERLWSLNVYWMEEFRTNEEKIKRDGKVYNF